MALVVPVAAQAPSHTQAGAATSSRYPLLTSLRKMNVKKQSAGTIQTAVKTFLLLSVSTVLQEAPKGAGNAPPKQESR